MKSNAQDQARAELSVVVDPSHPIVIGKTVTIIQTGKFGAPFREGHAVVKGLAQGHDCYRVQFLGDPVVRVRIVHPDYQADPHRMLEIMLDLWSGDNAASPAIDDFFPDDIA